jgi:hypothetical protein
MAATSVRWECVRDVIEGTRNQPNASGVQVEYGYPGDNAGPELLYVYSLEGTMDIPVMSAGRKPRSDTFVITLRCSVTGQVDLEQAQGRVSEILAATEDYLADYSTLSDDMTGVTMSARITDMRQAGALTPAGPEASGFVDIEVHTRLS